MSINSPGPVTESGDLDVLDRAGCVVNIGLSNANGEYSPPASSLIFQSKSFSKPLQNISGGSYSVTLLPSEVIQLKAMGSTRFVILDSTSTPPSILWEGFLFIRTVD